MIQNIRLMENSWGEFDIIIDLDKLDAEFAPDFLTSDKVFRNADKRLRFFIEHKARGLVIGSIKFAVTGVIVGTIAFSSYMALYASADDLTSLGYLYSGTSSQQISYVQRTGGGVDTVSPSYFYLNADGSLKENWISSQFITAMHADGVRVVPLLSNNWDKALGIAAINNMARLTDQIADAVTRYDLDGVHVDIENLSEIQRQDYVKFVAMLRDKLGSDKELSVAVASNPSGATTGWAASYDYEALADYADYLMIMTYDEHYEGGSAGPVASLSFVENSIKYALKKTTADKIMLGLPFYGRLWSSDGRFNGNGINLTKAEDLISDYGATVTYDSSSGSMKAQFTVRSGSAANQVGGITLKTGNYTLWYDNETTLAKKMTLVSKYNLKGAACWALGQEPVSLWKNYTGYLHGTTPVPAITTSVSSQSPSPSSSAAPVSSSKPASSAATSSKAPSSSKAPASSAPPASSSATSAKSSAPTSSVPPASASTEPASSSAPATISSSSQQETVESVPAVPSQEEASSEAPEVDDDRELIGEVKWTSRLSLLYMPVAGAVIIASIMAGERLLVLRKVGRGWYKVRRKNGEEGYVESRFISLKDNENNGEMA